MSLLPRFYSLLKMASGMVYLIQQREREERQNEMKKTKQGKWVERQRTIGRNREPNNKTNSTELGCANLVFCFKKNPTPPLLQCPDVPFTFRFTTKLYSFAVAAALKMLLSKLSWHGISTRIALLLSLSI